MPGVETTAGRAAPAPQAILDALPTEVVILDGQGRIQAVNEAWSRFGRGNGAGVADWKGADYLGVSRGPDGGDATRLGIQAILEGTRARFELEYPCHSADEQRWFEMTASRLTGQGGPWVVIAHTDITARHEVEQLRRQKWRDAEAIRAGLERARFIHGFANEMAHELNTPLTTLGLRIRALEPQLPVEALDALKAPFERMARSTRRIAAIVQALGRPSHPAPVLVSLLAEALVELEPEAGRRGLVLSSSLPDLTVQADPELLRECVSALVASCAASCPSGGSLRLEATPQVRGVRLVVEGDSVGDMGGSDADLWLLSARELARQAGLALAESALPGPRVSFALEVPLAPAAALGSEDAAAAVA